MADRAGQQLSSHCVISLIGHGGFADVYPDEHIYLKTQVAIKILQTISPDVEQVVNTALAKDAKQRFGSVQAFANANAFM